MEFTLNVSFTNDQLNAIYQTGNRVIIAKPTGGSGQPNVAWLAFDPFQANAITWEEEYGIYVSTQEIESGATLTQLSSVPVGAASGKIYTLQPSAVVTGPTGVVNPTSYALLNQYSNVPFMTVGLFQDATVNGTQILNSAVSAAQVMLQETAIMTPFTTVYIWLQSNVTGNSVITTSTTPMTALRFGGNTTDISVSYDTATGLFDVVQ